MKLIKINTDYGTMYINPYHIVYVHTSTLDENDTIIELSDGQSIFTQLSIAEIQELIEYAQ